MQLQCYLNNLMSEGYHGKKRTGNYEQYFACVAKKRYRYISIIYYYIYYCYVVIIIIVLVILVVVVM